MSTYTFTYGRFNPPHAGHEKLVDAVHKHAKGGEYGIHTSQSQDPKKNPLYSDEKVGHMKKMFPNHADKIHTNKTVFDALKQAHERGHKNVHMIVGSDRVKEFHDLVHKYNGHPSSGYKFDKIKVSSAGHRDPDSEDNVEGLSASKMRGHAATSDHESFHKGMPKHISKEYSHSLMTTVRDRMAEHPKKKAKVKKESYMTYINFVMIAEKFSLINSLNN